MAQKKKSCQDPKKGMSLSRREECHEGHTQRDGSESANHLLKEQEIRLFLKTQEAAQMKNFSTYTIKKGNIFQVGFSIKDLPTEQFWHRLFSGILTHDGENEAINGEFKVNEWGFSAAGVLLIPPLLTFYFTAKQKKQDSCNKSVQQHNRGGKLVW